VKEAVEKVYSGTTLADIVEKWQKSQADLGINYEI
jgi:hypothetical protein